MRRRRPVGTIQRFARSRHPGAGMPATPTSPPCRWRCGLPTYVGPVTAGAGRHEEALLAFSSRSPSRDRRAAQDTLGRFGRRPRRLHVAGARGWDVAELQFRLARHLPVGAVRRRLRPSPEGCPAALPAFRSPAADRHRRAENPRCAASGSAHEPAPSQPAGCRRARRWVRAEKRLVPCRPRLRSPRWEARDGRPCRTRGLGRPAEQFRQRRRRRARPGGQDALRASG